MRKKINNNSLREVLLENIKRNQIEDYILRELLPIFTAIVTKFRK